MVADVEDAIHCEKIYNCPQHTVQVDVHNILEELSFLDIVPIFEQHRRKQNEHDNFSDLTGIGNG